MKDEVTIVASDQSVAGWQDVSITRSIETFPSSFQLGLTENYPNAQEIVMIPGTNIYIKIGDDLILTGYIDQYNSEITPETHDVRINGRSLCEDLVDCSALFNNNVVMAAEQTIEQLAQYLCTPFAIIAKNNSGDPGPQIPVMVINLGETPYEIIEKCARWVGLLVYDDVNGNLVLDRAGSTTMDSGFQQGKNIQSASSRLQIDQRFSDYYVVWQAVNSQADQSGTDTNQHGYAQDEALKSIGRNRPHYIVSQLTDSTLGAGFDLGQRIADWECNRRIGRSQSVTLTTDTWRDRSGKLWQPNAMVFCDIPVIKMSEKNWIIASVTFNRNGSTGTTATLTLMPKDAFNIEPISFGGLDQDTLQGIVDGTSSPITTLPARDNLA